MPVSSEYLHINGVQLHLLRAGSGPRAVVLTHGNSHCGGVWLPLIEALAGDELTVVAPDLRGHGWSDKPDDGYGWEQLRDDLVGIVQALGLRDVLYAGHSRGGGVSLLAAAATPAIARGVFVYEPTIGVRAGPEGLPAPIETGGRGNELAARAERRRERFPDRAALAAYYRSREGFSGWRQDYFDAFVHYGTLVNEDGTASPCVPPRAAARLLEATFDFAPWRDVLAPALRVHVMFGERSGRLAPGRDPLAAIRLLFPRSESSVMPGATHTGPMEQPELFERRLREFDATLTAPERT